MHSLLTNTDAPLAFFNGSGLAIPGLVLIVVLMWELVFKGWALWLAARRGDKVWFVVLLLVHTLGILDIIYIVLVAKREDAHPVDVHTTE